MEELANQFGVPAEMIGAIIGVYAGIIIFVYAIFWKIFTKAGHPGWKAIIPFYNYYIYAKIIGKPGYWLVLFIIPYVSAIFLIWSINLLRKKFDKSLGYFFGLLFLPYVFFPMLAFGSAHYQDDDTVSEGDVLDEA